MGTAPPGCSITIPPPRTVPSSTPRTAPAPSSWTTGSRATRSCSCATRTTGGRSPCGRAAPVARPSTSGPSTRSWTNGAPVSPCSRPATWIGTTSRPSTWTRWTRWWLRSATTSPRSARRSTRPGSSACIGTCRLFRPLTSSLPWTSRRSRPSSAAVVWTGAVSRLTSSPTSTSAKPSPPASTTGPTSPTWRRGRRWHGTAPSSGA